MSKVLQGIAARYASALKASSTLSASSGDGRPAAADIWLYKLEDAVCNVVQHGRARRMPHGKYDHNWQYGHRHCLRTVEDVRAAPDDALLEALGLPNVARWGWLHFMIRDLSWFSLLANNWGLPSILTEYGGGGDVFAAEDERRAEAALHFLSLMREFGIDPVGQLDQILNSVRSRYAGMFKRPLEEEQLRPWLRRRNEFCYFVHACHDFKFRPGVRSEYSEVKYTGPQRAEFLAQVRAAAANRRLSRNAPHPKDCTERQKVVELEEGLETERRHIEEQLNDQHRARWVAEMGTTPEHLLWPELMKYFADGRTSRDKWDTGGRMDVVKLDTFLVANPKALDLLRWPENFEVALVVVQYLSWVYLPGAHYPV
jgi:hypothetical protein